MSLGKACRSSAECDGYPQDARCMMSNMIELTTVSPTLVGQCTSTRGKCTELQCDTDSDCPGTSGCTACMDGYCAYDFSGGFPVGTPGCTVDDDCADENAVCSFVGRDGFDTGVCTLPTTSACGNASLPCRSNDECPSECAYCVDNVCQDTPAPADAKCVDDDQCASGLVCKDGKCAEPPEDTFPWSTVLIVVLVLLLVLVVGLALYLAMRGGKK